MKKRLACVLVGVYIVSTFVFFNISNSGISGIPTPESFAMMCLSYAYPSLSYMKEDSSASETATENEEEEPIERVISTGDPLVLIVHTHATESYLPSDEGNYHKKKEKNTVRDVGNVLAESLEKCGVASVHDTTLHDSPSYSNSYTRSYETTEALLKKYPSIECIIDLHRDAVSSKGTAATISVNGKKCAKYSYVLSTAVDTYKSNRAFIKALNSNAAADFNGFTGSILERGYRYNQNLSDKYLLLEIGYNRNDIEEARNTAEILGKVLAKTLLKGE